MVFVPDNKIEKTWAFFLDFIERSLQKPYKEKRIISKKKIKGQRLQLKNVSHVVAIFWFPSNILKTADALSEKLFSEVLAACTASK